MYYQIKEFCIKNIFFSFSTFRLGIHSINFIIDSTNGNELQKELREYKIYLQFRKRFCWTRLLSINARSRPSPPKGLLNKHKHVKWTAGSIWVPLLLPKKPQDGVAPTREAMALLPLGRDIKFFFFVIFHVNSIILSQFTKNNKINMNF